MSNFYFTKSAYEFKPVYLSNESTIDTQVRNNDILPETQDFDVVSPFKMDDALTASISNPYNYNADDIVTLHDIVELEDKNVLILFSSATSLIRRIVTPAGVASDSTIDTNTYDGGVIAKTLASTTSIYIVYVYSGTTITVWVYNGTSWGSQVISPTLDGSAETVSSINGFVGSGKVYSPYINAESYAASFYAGLSYNDGSNDGMLLLGYDASFVGLTVRGDSTRLDFTPVKMFDVDYIDGPVAQVLSDDGKVYSLKTDIWYNYTTPTTNMYNEPQFVDIVSEDNEAFFAGRNNTLEVLQRSDWNINKVGYVVSSTYVEFSINGVSGEDENIQGIQINLETLGVCRLVFGYYDGTSTWQANQTENHGTANTYTEYDSISAGLYPVGTHVRVYGYWANINVTQVVSGISTVLLNVDGYETTVGAITSGTIRSHRMVCDKIDDYDSYTMDDTVRYVQAHNNKVASCVDAEVSYGEVLFMVDSDENYRRGLYELGADGIPIIRALFQDGNTYNAFVWDSVQEKIYNTILDSDFDRTDDAVDVEFSVLTAVAGRHDSDVVDEDSAVVATLTTFVIDSPVLPVVPYGLVMFGYGHKDFMRTDSTTKSLNVYVSGDNYNYNRVESVLTADIGNGEYEIEAVSPELQTEGEDIDAYIDTINLYFDPTLEGVDVKDNTIRVHIVTAVSMHPVIADWTSDGNYQMNGYGGVQSLGDAEETAEYGNTPLMVSGTKQIVVRELAIDSRIGRCIRFRVELSKTDLDNNAVYDDFKVFYVKLMQPELFDIGGEDA